MLNHLGIIADGNRRWAKEHGLPSFEGHRRGIKVIEELIDAAIEAKIPFITFYVFSTENWGREKSEVDYIMKLAEARILRLAEKLKKKNTRIFVLGSKKNASPKLISLAEKAQKMTQECSGTTVCFCFNYGGELEIAEAANKAIAAKEKITPETIRKHLYKPEVPDVDMVVRTNGEERISGFMLWRVAYAEFMFMKKFFPEMEGSDINKIIAEYEKRHRRFGK